MEEVDGIILSQLRLIGTNIDEDVSSIREMSTESLVEGCAKCLNTINGDDKLPTKLPGAMSARFRVGTELANAMKALGYGTDVGYNTFLYSNENDSRQILMWLIERLPKEASSSVSEALDAKALFKRAVAKELQLRSESEWTPTWCKQDGIAWRGTKDERWSMEGRRACVDFHAIKVLTPVSQTERGSDSASKEAQRYFKEYMPLVTDQPCLRKHVPASVLATAAHELVAQQEWELEWSTKGVRSGLNERDYRDKKRKTIRQKMNNQLRAAVIRSEAEGKRENDMTQFLNDFADADTGKGSKFQHQASFVFAKEAETDPNAPKPATEEEIQEQRETELQKLETTMTDAVAKLKDLKTGIAKFVSGIEQADDQAEKLDKQNLESEEQYKMRKKILDLLPNADENIARLKQVVESSTKRILALASKWETRRSELFETLRKLRRSQGDAEGHAKLQLEEIKVVRAEMKEIAESAKEKDGIIAQLQADLASVSTQVARSSYTRRIMEIVRNISRQKEDIDKVLQDSRVVQKDINQLTEKANRIFLETDEMIFKNAKKDEQSRRAYKLLASLHETCENIIKIVEGTGHNLRESRELEEQIEAEQKKNMAESLGRISNDLKMIKKENKGMLETLKS